MKDKKRFQLYLVDDDALFLKSLQIDFFQFTDYNIKTFATGELCMEYLSDIPDIIILDYELDGINREAMNGIQTLDKIKLFNPEIPVVMLSSQDKIEVAIDCMHHKAFDYVIKSETAFMHLQKKISSFFKFKEIEQDLNWYMNRM